jgi:hypothetical protein
VPQEIGRALGERFDQTLALKLISHAEDGGVLAAASRCRRGQQRSASFTTSAQPRSAAQPIIRRGSRLDDPHCPAPGVNRKSERLHATD